MVYQAAGAKRTLLEACGEEMMTNQSQSQGVGGEEMVVSQSLSEKSQFEVSSENQ